MIPCTSFRRDGRHSQALAIARKIGTLLEAARALEGIGQSHLQDGNSSQATAHLREALAIHQRIGSPAAQRVQKHCANTNTSQPTPAVRNPSTRSDDLHAVHSRVQPRGRPPRRTVRAEADLPSPVRRFCLVTLLLCRRKHGDSVDRDEQAAWQRDVGRCGAGWRRVGHEARVDRVDGREVLDVGVEDGGLDQGGQ